MRGKYLIIPCLLLWAAGVSAQQKWDLQQCISHAQAHNIQLKQQAQVVKNQEISLNSARNNRLPGVDASASQSFNFGRGLTIENTYVNRNTLSTSFSANASMSVYDGGQITRNIQVQKLQLEASMADLTRAQENLSLQVASVYLEVLFQEELLDVARQQCQLSQSQADRIKKLLDAGKAAESEWADAKALVAADEMSATQAENNYRLSLLTLSQLLELPSPEGFSVVKPELPAAADVVLPLPDAIMAEAVGIKPEIKAGEYRVKSAERSILLAKTGYYPKLNLGAGLGTSYYKTSGYETTSFGRQMKENFNRYIGLSLSVPVFNRLQTRNQIRSARVQLYTQQLALEQTRKDIYKEIQQAYYNAMAAQRQCQSAVAAEEASQASFALTATKYENGQSTATEFQEAKTRLAKAQSDGLQARYSFFFRTKILDFYRGVPF
ncbi:MAG: TolC family protein [Bacteroidaceae bacterium]|nr:TolC family protein [Bacteroidaceae bacterium]